MSEGMSRAFLAELVEVADRLGHERSRHKKRDLVAGYFSTLEEEDLGLAVAYLSGVLPQGRIGLGNAFLHKWSSVRAAEESTLQLVQVEETLGNLRQISGAKSESRKAALWQALLLRAREAEQGFLLRLLRGELRQGALEGVMAEGLAKALDLDAAAVRRAAMMRGALYEVTPLLKREGAAGFAQIHLRIFQPLQPMLAEPCASVSEAWARLAQARHEYKLDGVRIQVHRQGERVRIYSRSLQELTAAMPEVVRAVSALPAESLVLDGEVISVDGEGMPHPFQVTMQRAGRRQTPQAEIQTLPLRAFFFDCLHAGGQDFIDRPLWQRVEALEREVPAEMRVPALKPASEVEAQAFYDAALAAGHEGVMVKSLDSTYAAGARGASWLKLKDTHSADLVVLAAEWGSGRRRGWLSNLHLGARDEASGAMVMVGKTFKGLSDALLRWQTEAFPAHQVSADAHTVYLAPHFVVEIVFNEVQRSPHYPGGIALRFARVKGYRSDKAPAEADTLARLRALCRLQASPEESTD